ncbi:unnamed protein product [Lymnaea stagnalis]|uniref:VWFC domain-containing protein n=1 Tax=Lymnaea stagnalis TaxID=6523 RepID=A0AAV2HND2_LYMST
MLLKICIVAVILHCLGALGDPKQNDLQKSDADSRVRKGKFCTYIRKKYPLGAKFKPDDCSICTCGLTTRQVHCEIQKCDKLPCKDPVFVKGQCCPICCRPFNFYGERHNIL